MASSERDGTTPSGVGAQAPGPGAPLVSPRPAGTVQRRGDAGPEANTGPRIELTLADPARVKVVRRSPGPPSGQRPAPGPKRQASGSGEPQSPQSTMVWRSVETGRLHSSWLRPRAPYDEETVRGLADSLARTGWQHPVLVRPHPVIARDFEIVVGELPVQAARCAGLAEVTVMVCRLTDRRALECVLLEDVRRPDLTPFEVAVGYGQLIRTFRYSLPVLAKLVGKSERQVVHTLLLLDSAKPAPDVRVDLEARQDPQAPAGAARPPATAPGTAAGGGGPALHTQLAALERHLSRAMGLEVALSDGDGHGDLRISYANIDQLEWLARRLLAMSAHQEPEPTRPGLAA